MFIFRLVKQGNHSNSGLISLQKDSISLSKDQRLSGAWPHGLSAVAALRLVGAQSQEAQVKCLSHYVFYKSGWYNQASFYLVHIPSFK